MTLPGLCVDGVSGAFADPVATPLLAAVMQAVIDLYESAPNVDAPCAWGILGGAQLNVDRGGYVGTGCAGLLTVRLVSLTPAEMFPGDSGGPVRMFDLSYAANVEVGVWRPSPEPTETGDGLVLPPLEEEQAAAEQVALDAAVVRAGLLSYARNNDVPIVLGAFLPWGPEGGVIGGATTALFEIV